MTTRLIVLSLSFAVLLAGASTADAQRRRAADTAAAASNTQLGAGYLQNGRYDLAIDPLLKALEYDPRYAEAHSTIALVYDRQGHTELAAEHYERAAELAPDNPEVANTYGVFLCRQQRWKEALPYFRKAASVVTYKGEVALTNAGVCALEGNMLPEAEPFLRDALQRNPRFPDALAAMVDVSVRNRDYLRGRAFVQRYLEAGQPNPTVLLRCFTIETELNDRAAADRCAAQLRERFPNSPESRSLQEHLTRNGR